MTDEQMAGNRCAACADSLEQLMGPPRNRPRPDPEAKEWAEDPQEDRVE